MSKLRDGARCIAIADTYEQIAYASGEDDKWLKIRVGGFEAGFNAGWAAILKHLEGVESNNSPRENLRIIKKLFE